MYVNPGELNKWIDIIKISSGGRDKDGFEIEPAEEIIRSCSAKITNMSGSEIYKSGSEFSDVKKRFLVRYSDVTINTDMSVRYAGKNYDIEYVNPYNDGKEYIEIWTKISERV